ncbi:MAG: hypothetical protein K6F00_04760 [Lachnospiraceae bacterium]|nr:hypothetical protein [Lachnospiraceae bacterium]
MKEEKFSPIRILFLIAGIVLCIGQCIYLCLRRSFEIKDMIIFVIIALMLTLAIFLTVITQRRSEEGFYNGTNYRNLLLVLLVGWILIDLSQYIPVMFFPVALLVAFLACELDGMLSMSMSMGMILLLCITDAVPHTVIFAYVFECIFAGLLCDYMKKTQFRHKVWPALMIFMAEFTIKVTFYYYTYQELAVDHLIFAGVAGALAAIFVMTLFPFLSDILSREKEAFYDTLLDEEHPLLLELKEYSIIDYAHALRVGELARDCALEVGADANLAAAGGIYYRIGKIYGDPETENAIIVAHRYNFPKELISILYEYEGTNRKPTSLESAIVLMADHVVKKIEVIKNQSDSMDSNWNQNMLIYQTLNELSNTGIFDDSGLGMNKFLKIRERLVQEEKR